MRLRTIFLVFLILVAAGVAITSARYDGTNDGMEQQLRNENQTQEQLQDQLENQVRNQTQEQDRLENRTEAQNRTREQLEEREQERQQNQTRAMDVTELHQQLQQRKQELEQEWASLSPDQQRIFARYSNVSAFVHVLLNESQTRALLGEGPMGIGPQVSAYAREFNNSVRAQFQAEDRIENRNALVRFFAGGDEEAAGILEQETLRNKERIQQMQQLIAQCQDCDSQLREMLQEQLQDMEEQQTRLQQLAQKEKQDKGIFGWLWK